MTPELIARLKLESERHCGRATLDDQAPTVQILLLEAAAALAALSVEVREKQEEIERLRNGNMTPTNSQDGAGRYQLVPVEPTDRMISAAMHCLDGVNLKEHGHTYGEQKYYKYVMRYKAMLAAARTPANQEQTVK